MTSADYIPERSPAAWKPAAGKSGFEQSLCSKIVDPETGESTVTVAPPGRGLQRYRRAPERSQPLITELSSLHLLG